MKSYNALARIAYAAYATRIGQDQLASKPQPLWAELSVVQQAAWIKVVESMLSEFRALH